MLQNRVNPFGDLIVTKARGEWLGNRGQLHGCGKTILRPFKHKAWIICKLQFKNRHREIMAPNLWTELFFLDEATALSAGHRPCFECRREDAMQFKRAWVSGNPQHGFDIKTPICKIDEIIHAERIDGNGEKVLWKASLTDLPNSTFISVKGNAYRWTGEKLKCWSSEGYLSVDLPDITEVDVLTPRSIVNALKSGYSAGS